MDTFKVNLDQIVWDFENRVNPDTDNLRKSIQTIGVIMPLLVVGPDDNNLYYLIDGSRRYNVLKDLSRTNTEYRQVLVWKIKNTVGSRVEREILRFHLENNSKKIIGAEEQSIIENIQDMGGYSDNELVNIAQPKQARIKRMKKSREIDKALRDEVSKKRASQHALEVIYNMTISKRQWSKLYNLLLNRKITGSDADALKKLNNDTLFDKLTGQQKSNAIKKVLNQSRFTDKEAKLIILTELMKERPTEYKDDSFEWINYLVSVLENVSEMINPDIEGQETDLQRVRLRSALSSLTSSLSWTWDKQYRDEQLKREINNPLTANIISEETEKGFKFRIH